jgi:hypothetical protein
MPGGTVYFVGCGMTVAAMCRMGEVGVGNIAGRDVARRSVPGVKMARAMAGYSADGSKDREEKGRREAAGEAGYEHPMHRRVHFCGSGLLSSRKTCGDTVPVDYSMAHSGAPRLSGCL